MMMVPRAGDAPGEPRGFTLVEMLIVVAVVAVLVAIALPSYQDYLRRGNRADAKAVLMETAQFMDRYYTTNNTFVGAAVLTTVSPKGSTGTKVKYNISFTAAPTATAFVVQAVPANSQAGDPCGTLTLSNTGAQTAAQANCW